MNYCFAIEFYNFVNTLMLKKISLVFLLSLCFNCAGAGQQMWNVERLNNKPDVYKAPGFSEPGVNALFFRGPDYQGRHTRVFAFIGMPENIVGLAPAVVLVHGGGGTACADWVRLWNSKGYAAIAIDTTGSVPDGQFPSRKKHDDGGPDGWGGFEQIGHPMTDQWTYHAVSNIILAHSLLRSYNEVDRHNVGVTGISWGGYLACIAAGVDYRLAFAIPVYGCGFLQQDSDWSRRQFASMGRENANRWSQLWDPSSYLRECLLPVLWVSGTNDAFFPLSSYSRTYSLVRNSTLCIKPELGHSHADAFKVDEIYAFADSVSRGGQSPILFTRQGVTGRTAWTHYGNVTMPQTATLVYTTDSSAWKDRRWQQIPAKIDYIASSISAVIPENAKVYFFNATDDRGLVFSSKHRGAPR